MTIKPASLRISCGDAPIAAHQCEGAWNEGGKGVSTADIARLGGIGKVRQLDDKVDPDVRYPSHTGIDFYHRWPPGH